MLNSFTGVGYHMLVFRKLPYSFLAVFGGFGEFFSNTSQILFVKLKLIFWNLFKWFDVWNTRVWVVSVKCHTRVLRIDAGEFYTIC